MRGDAVGNLNVNQVSRFQLEAITSRRVVDVVVAAAFLILFAPLWLAVAILVKLAFKGSIIVREPRLGWTTKPVTPERISVFNMYRFRTTTVPDPNIPRLMDKEHITHVGRFLQMTSLDEVPQMINVLKGEMSIIGPRPLVLDAFQEDGWKDTYRERFSVRPGIIGLWQVSRDHIGTMDEMAAVDNEYLRNRSLGYDLKIVARSFGAILRRSSLQHWVSRSKIAVQENVYYSLGKRFMDILISAVALVMLSPLLLIVAILIRLDSPGPVVFRQVRAGKRVLVLKDGTPLLVSTEFTIYKFRTMHNDQGKNDAIHQKWVQDWKNGKINGKGDPEQLVKPASDPRITRLGRILRATSIDELLQLINVLKGDMSLVGPRPVPVYEVAAYDEEHHTRLDAIPGLTGWWQINLRGRGTLDQMVELDLEYLKKRSLWTDIKIMFLTVPAVIKGRGAK